MISGITRYTLGARNDTAIADVVAKAKELYIDPTPPPSSGVIVNTVEEIWADMHDANTGQPAASSMSYGYVQGPIMTPSLNPDDPDWRRINAWIEIEQGCGTGYQDCMPATGTSVNTRVEVTPMWLMYQDLSGGRYGNGAWHVLHDGTGTITTTIFPGNHGGDYETDRGCTDAEVTAIRLAWEGYDPFVSITSEGNYIIHPDHYYWMHGWSTQLPFDPSDACVIYAGCYTRLVLIDPNGVDDRHLANFVIHQSSDKKEVDGTIVRLGEDAVGISRYKLIPTNGDWMPVNLIGGYVTEESLTMYPPPFPTAPAPI